MDSHVAIRMLLILAATIVLFGIVAYYTKNKNGGGKQGFSQRGGRVSGFRERFDDYGAANGADSLRPPSGKALSPPSASQSSFGPGDLAAPYPASVRASDTISDEQQRALGRAARSAPATQKACFPKDELSPEDLIPKDSADSRWARMNPAGQGDIKDQNFLSAGYNLGIDTQSSSLRNANLQIRSEPPNSQFKVSPWQQSTIQPDTNRRPLEIGGDY